MGLSASILDEASGGEGAASGSDRSLDGVLARCRFGGACDAVVFGFVLRLRVTIYSMGARAEQGACTAKFLSLQIGCVPLLDVYAKNSKPILLTFVHLPTWESHDPYY